MQKLLNEYHKSLLTSILKKIDEELNDSQKIEADISSAVNDKGTKIFQVYYKSTLKNEKSAFANINFFKKFKKKHALQGIDNEYLERLEKDKSIIINLIKEDRIFELYQNYFYQAKIKHKDAFRFKNLGSFCAKLTHTFSPEKYCPLDVPIKNFFKLENESFFTAFLLISEAYTIWSKNNDVNSLKDRAIRIDVENKLFIDEMTNLKFLDFIFWKRANIDAKTK